MSRGDQYMTDSILGGMLIGLAVSMMLLFNGKVTGISGILGGIINHKTSDKLWRITFLVGLLFGGALLRFFGNSSAFQITTQASNTDYVIAGLLVGFGTLLGNGCTSGHGVCGISRFSPRSILATVLFIFSGVLSVISFKLIRGEL